VEINPDNFDSVLKGMSPHLKFSVENKLSSDPGRARLEWICTLTSWMISILGQWRSRLNRSGTADLRTRLSNLRGSLQGNDQLDQALSTQ